MQVDDSLFNFPCDFPVKVMGLASPDFDSLVISLIRKHSPDLHEGAIQTRLSQGGRYMAVTVTIQAQSRDQLDNIYRELTADSRVLVAL